MIVDLNEQEGRALIERIARRAYGELGADIRRRIGLVASEQLADMWAMSRRDAEAIMESNGAPRVDLSSARRAYRLEDVERVIRDRTITNETEQQ